MRTPPGRTAPLLLVGLVTLVALVALVAPAATAMPVTPVKTRPKAPTFPPDVKAMGDKLKGSASPAVKAWAAQNAGAVAKGTGDPETLARTAAHARWPNLRAGSYDALVFLLIYEAAENVIAQIQQTLDSKSELGETESLRLQMAMDRVSKFMTALSNLLQKISDTDSALVQNLK